VARAGGSWSCLLFPGVEPWSFVIPSGCDWSDALTWVPDNQVSFFFYQINFNHPYENIYFPVYNIMIIKAIPIIPASEVYPNYMLLYTQSRKGLIIINSMKNDIITK
jgi:hypothetical protein